MSEELKRGEELWAAAMDEELPERYDEAPDKKTAFDRLMDRAISKGPNKAKAKEFLAEDDAEPSETEEPTSLVGTMTAETAAVASPSGYGHTSSTVYAPGGIVSSPHTHTTVGTPSSSIPWTSPATVYPAPGTGTMVWPTSPPATPAAAPKKKAAQVPLPSKFTEKVLVAFLEEREGMDDELVWAAHLLSEHFEMRLEDGEIRLVLEFSLRDHYDNNPATED